MIKTSIGLPNSCSKCGKVLANTDRWNAESIDAALSGSGICDKCAKQKTPAPKDAEGEPEQPVAE